MMKKYRKPSEIQHFLNSIQYRPAGGAFSPLVVERTRAANCFDGAVYAAAALETLGYPPLILDMAAKKDDDHIIAVYRMEGWGAIAKSNTTMLRSREPVYRSIRELVMSYFDVYFNTRGYKSLRSYSVPINMRKFDALSWRTSESPLDQVEECLNRAKHYPIITRQMERMLCRTDSLLIRACFLHSNRKGLYRPE